MRTKTIKFSDFEKKILVELLTKRIDFVVKENENWHEAPKSQLEKYYDPFLKAKLKIEDKFDLYTKGEKIAMRSCLNEEISINDSNKEVLKIILKKINK